MNFPDQKHCLTYTSSMNNSKGEMDKLLLGNNNMRLG